VTRELRYAGDASHQTVHHLDYESETAMSTATTITQLFSGGLRPFPGIPTEWPHQKRLLAQMILDDIECSFPDLLGDVVPGADVEDFWEDACRIAAAWQASGNDLQLKASGEYPGAWSADELDRRLGPVGYAEEGGRHAPDELVADPVLHAHGGRGMLLGSLGGDPSTDVAVWFAARHREHGVQRGIVKVAAAKNGIWAIELDSDPEVIRQRLSREMDWTYVRLEGPSRTVIAQDVLDLQYEYRLFIVDGKVVSGAGCIEEFTPLDRPAGSGPFDLRVRKYRGHMVNDFTVAIEERPNVVERLLTFGREIAHEHGGTVVIDVAIDAAAGEQGAPVVLELNRLSNSGLYASDPWAVARALTTATDRGYRV
jgi:hypothetical protein